MRKMLRFILPALVILAMLLPVLPMSPLSGVASATTTSFYSASGSGSGSTDGVVARHGVDETWATLRAGAGTAVSTVVNDLTVFIQSTTTSNQWQQINQSILTFDTSSLPNDAIITSVTLSLYGETKTDNLSISPEINVYGASPASDDDLVTADYGTVGATAYCDTPIGYAGWNTGTPGTANTFIFNLSGIAAVSLVGDTKLGLRNNFDASGTPPTWSSNKSSDINPWSADKGGGYRPTLEVTYYVTGGVAPTGNITAQPSTKDNFIYAFVPNANYGTSVSLALQALISSQVIRSILSFDIATIPAGSIISDATLSLYYYSKPDLDPAGKTVLAHRMTELDWEESTSTWNSHKTGNTWAAIGGDYTNTDVASTTVPASVNTWMDWNITDQVATAYNALSTVDVLLHYDNENQGGIYTVLWYSNDYVGNTSLCPKLYVEYYAAAGPTITTLAATGVGTTSATLNGNVTLTLGGDTTPVGFVWDTVSMGYPGNITPSIAGYSNYYISGSGSYGNGTTFYYNIPAGSLTPGDTIYFRAAGYNSDGWGYGSESVLNVGVLPGTMSVIGSWTPSISSFVSVMDLLYDGTYLYASSVHTSSSSMVTKINPLTMTTVSTWVCPIAGNLEGLCYDGTYIYAATFTSPARVYKINRSTMATVSVWTGVAGQEEGFFISCDSQYVYVPMAQYGVQNVLYGKVIKIRSSDMTTSLVWTDTISVPIPATPTYYLGAFNAYLYEGYLYVASENPAVCTARVTKVNPTTMVTVDSWSASVGGFNGVGVRMVGNGGYLYVGAGGSPIPANVYKIEIATMNEVDIWTGGTHTGTPEGSGTWGLVWLNNYLFEAELANPGIITQINPITMNTVGVWTGTANQYAPSSMATDGTHLYVGLDTYPNYSAYPFILKLAVSLPPVDIPSIYTVGGTDLTNTSATLQGSLASLGNYTPVYTYFQYGLTTSYGISTIEQTKTVIGGYTQATTGLSPSTTYHMRAVARYDGANYVYGSDGTFTTTTVVVIGAPTGLTATRSTGQIALSWTNGSNAVNTMVRRGTTTYPSTTSDGTQVYFGTGMTITDTSVTDTQGYYYSAWSELNSLYSSSYATVYSAPTTGTGVLNTPDTFIIYNVMTFKKYQQNNDQIILIYYEASYNASTPTQDVRDFLAFELYSGSTLIAKVPVQMWGERPGSIYLAPSNVMNWGQSFIVKIVGRAGQWGVIPSYSYSASSYNWDSTPNDLSDIDTWVWDTAVTIDPDWVVATSTGYALTDTACTIFNRGIAGLSNVRATVCYSTSIGLVDIPDEFDTDYQDELTAGHDTVLGSYLNGFVDGVSTITGTSNQVSGYIVTIIVCLIMFMAIGFRTGSVGYAIAAVIPVLIFHAYAALIGIVVITILLSILVLYAVKKLWA